MLLIVEGDSRFSAKMKKGLRIDGLRNFFVKSDRDALFLLKSMKADFILVNLNGVASFEYLEKLIQHARTYQCPMLFIEGFTRTRSTGKHLRTLGEFAYIKLPFRISELAARIKAMRSSDDPMLGVMLGPKGHELEIVKKIGGGAAGTVYEAYDRALERRLAIKILSEENRTKDAESARRFANEAKAMAQMRNPHIVQVFSVGTYGDRPYMAMELIDGPNLSKYMRTKKVLTPNEALDICRQILIGLSHAHQHKKVHRDMKPANIMLNKEGQAVILDFGLVREVTNQTLTTVGTIMGTPRYIPPEQAKGEGVDSRGDLYSVGIILYEMLAGEPPYKGDDFVAVLMQHINEPLPKPEVFSKTLDPALYDIISKLTRKAADDRYQTAKEVIGDIDAWLEGHIQPSYQMRPRSVSVSMLKELEPVGGLEITEFGNVTDQFGEIRPGRVQSLHVFSSLIHQLRDIEDMGEFHRGNLFLDNSTIVVFPHHNGLAGIENEAADATVKLNRMSRDELGYFFEKDA